MKNSTFNTWSVSIVSFLLTLLFSYAGISKLADHTSFHRTLEQVPLLHQYASMISWALPAIEILTATLFLFHRLTKLALIASTILLLSFSLYILYMIKSAHNLPCSCGGLIKELTWSQHLIFNSFFLILGSIALIQNRKANSLLQ